MDRRDVLCSLGSVATLSVVAGCLGGDGEETPGSADPQEWVPDPNQISDSLDHYQVFSTAPAAVGERADRLSSSTWEQYQREWLDWDIANPNPADVERFTRGGDPEAGVGFGAVTHDLDGDQLRENLRDEGFEEDGSYEGFDVFVSANGQRARGLDGRRLAVGQHQSGGRTVVETVVDTGLGNTPPYGERETLTGLLQRLDAEHNFRFRTHPRNDVTIPSEGVFAGSVAQGYSLALGEEFTATRAERFVEDATIPTDALESYAQSNDLFDGAQNIELGTGSNVGLLTWTADPAALSLNQLG
jgi:hypothetical protein